jgi:hypothetical protein
VQRDVPQSLPHSSVVAALVRDGAVHGRRAAASGSGGGTWSFDMFGRKLDGSSRLNDVSTTSRILRILRAALDVQKTPDQTTRSRALVRKIPNLVLLCRLRCCAPVGVLRGDA